MARIEDEPGTETELDRGVVVGGLVEVRDTERSRVEGVSDVVDILVGRAEVAATTLLGAGPFVLPLLPVTVPMAVDDAGAFDRVDWSRPRWVAGLGSNAAASESKGWCFSRRARVCRAGSERVPARNVGG